MPTILKFRRFTTANTTTVTGAVGELTIDMDKDTVVVHDGATAGGKTLATESYADDLDTAVRSDLATLIADYDTSTEVDGKISTAISDKVTTTALSTLIADYDTATQVDFKVSTAISNLVDNAPGTLDTLNELSLALGNDHDYAVTITTALGTKANSSDMTTALGLKADASTVDSALALKADASTVDSDLALKAPLSSPALTDIPTAPTATVGTNTTQIATTAFAITQIQTELPTGFIGMWSGSAATIPVGWLLCDGTNSTPDLRDKFIVGAGTTYAPADTGGSATAQLTTNELPDHTHSGTTSSNGSHLHLIANTDVVVAGSDLTNSNYLADNGNIGTASNYNLGGSATTPTIGNTTNNGAHVHTFTTSSTGAGAEFDILPPYYALCFIMKTYA